MASLQKHNPGKYIYTIYTENLVSNPIYVRSSYQILSEKKNAVEILRKKGTMNLKFILR